MFRTRPGGCLQYSTAVVLLLFSVLLQPSAGVHWWMQRDQCVLHNDLVVTAALALPRWKHVHLPPCCNSPSYRNKQGSPQRASTGLLPAAGTVCRALLPTLCICVTASACAKSTGVTAWYASTSYRTARVIVLLTEFCSDRAGSCVLAGSTPWQVVLRHPNTAPAAAWHGYSGMLGRAMLEPPRCPVCRHGTNAFRFSMFTRGAAAQPGVRGDVDAPGAVGHVHRVAVRARRAPPGRAVGAAVAAGLRRRLGALAVLRHPLPSFQACIYAIWGLGRASGYSARHVWSAHASVMVLCFKTRPTTFHASIAVQFMILSGVTEASLRNQLVGAAAAGHSGGRLEQRQLAQQRAPTA